MLPPLAELCQRTCAVVAMALGGGTGAGITAAGRIEGIAQLGPGRESIALPIDDDPIARRLAGSPGSVPDPA